MGDNRHPRSPKVSEETLDVAAFVIEEVQQQGTSLVIMDKATGNCALVELRDLFDYAQGWDELVERLEGVFGEEVLEEVPA